MSLKFIFKDGIFALNALENIREFQNMDFGRKQMIYISLLNSPREQWASYAKEKLMLTRHANKYNFKKGKDF